MSWRRFGNNLGLQWLGNNVSFQRIHKLRLKDSAECIVSFVAQ